jgi:hypothetical protein
MKKSRLQGVIERINAVHDPEDIVEEKPGATEDDDYKLDEI